MNDLTGQLVCDMGADWIGMVIGFNIKEDLWIIEWFHFPKWNTSYKIQHHSITNTQWWKSCYDDRFPNE